MSTVAISKQELHQLKTELRQLRKENEALKDQTGSNNLTWDKVLDEIEHEGIRREEDMKKRLTKIRKIGKSSARRIIESKEVRENWSILDANWLYEQTSYD